METLCAIAFKTGVLLAIVGLASRILASRSAACRHLLWSTALLLSLLLPPASLVLPSLLTVAVPSYVPGTAIDELSRRSRQSASACRRAA